MNNTLAPVAPSTAPVVAVRRLIVRHKTTCRYDQPVTRSRHRIRLRPISDVKQSVQKYSLTLTPNAPFVESEDVFGNHVTAFEINQPYTELIMESRAEVQLLDVNPFEFADQLQRPSFPVVWMPRDQKMLLPYLTSQELPNTQLEELYDYGMSFVSKNKNDVLETLFNINLTLFRDYKYVPGSTTVATTPYDVFTSRQGVCQDFANLFITLARLLGLPARYVCGYIYTGNVGQARAQSDASHAWVQIYIPQIGWKGFDPTNGVLPHTDHVRIAVGRHYRDTAPNEGTLYSAANETMTVDVEVIDPDATAAPENTKTAKLVETNPPIPIGV